ncbi:hypothetical protein DQ04_00081070 [Trypanosoma grayi]|uniref:hypothetical protein n=1 Tax=Trypanosoma grayi TaxID=71804 RepID=UPI0004F3F6C4|nr:hypothetical protein DQ04_00081070 [Trypanosoma grayi]KEG15408.1 hypothetical protein DQ04_00081070 [Trypanosoma grayi]
MKEKLQNASREELMQHVLTQRLLIRHLHRRIVDLEEALGVFHAPGSRGASAFAPTPPEATPLPYRSPAPPPARASPEGLLEIDRLLKAHAAGEVRLRPEIVSELLYIVRELKDAGASENSVCSSGTFVAHTTPPRGLSNSTRAPAASAGLAGGETAFTTPLQRAECSTPRRCTPPASLVKRTQARLELQD